MKSFACVLMLVALVAAEPPNYRQSRFISKRQEQREPTTPTNDAAPYPAAGFQPSQEFTLPSRQETAPPATSYGVPTDSYTVPFNTYAAPQDQYGAPKNSDNGNPEMEGKKDDDSQLESLKVEGLENENMDKPQASSDDSQLVNAKGAYYVLLPDLQLQRVVFQTQNDLRNMAYTARLQYKNEDRAPIYVYTFAPQYQNAAYVQGY